MYRMIIADDEELIRNCLTKLVNWQELGFQIVKTFGNGEDVIDFLESEPVDVVLTDIMMPNVNGIDIARYIHDNNLNCKVVIITGYKKFELAQQAIRYGVEDFILKPSRKTEVNTVFQKLKKILDKSVLDLEKKKEIESQWEEMYPILRAKFVHDLVLGGFSGDRIDIVRRMRILYPEIDAQNSPCIIVTIKIENYDDYFCSKWNYSREQFDEAFSNFINFYQDNGFYHIVYRAKDIIRLFGIIKAHGGNPDENIDICINEIEQFVEQLKEIFELNITLNIEQIFDNINHVIDKRTDISIGQVGEGLHLLEQKKLIITNLMLGNTSTAQKVMDNIFRNCAGENIQFQRRMLMDVLSDICKYLQLNHFKLYQEIQPYINHQLLLNMTDISEMTQYCRRIFELINIKDSQIEQFDQNGLVDRIKKYVSEHIYEDIILDDIANEVFVCSTHIRRIFKKQTGETFLQFVTKKKMDKAIELLHDPQYKVYQVGEILGYKTPRYFSKLFYNFMGYYPNQYRKEVLKLGEVADEKK